MTARSETFQLFCLVFN